MKGTQVNSSPLQGLPTKFTPALKLLAALADFAAVDEDSPAVVTISVQILDPIGSDIIGVEQLTGTQVSVLAGLMTNLTPSRQSAGAL